MIKNLRVASVLSFAICLMGNVGLATAQCALPNQLTNGQVADASQVMANFTALVNCLLAAPGGTTGALQYNAGSGAFSGLGPLTNGQLAIGSTGNAPTAAVLTAGAGIAITNAPGSITIQATGGGGGGSVDWLNASAVTAPVAANFGLKTTTTPPAGAAISQTSRGMLLSTTSTSNSQSLMAEVNTPSGSWQATMLYIYTGPLSSYILPCISVRDNIASKSVQFGIGSGSGSSNSWRFDYQKTSGGVGLDNYSDDTSIQDTGLPQPSEPVWARLIYDGTNLKWSFSRDGEHFVTAFSVSATNYLTNLTTVGPAVMVSQPSQTSWATYMHVLSWNLASM